MVVLQILDVPPAVRDSLVREARRRGQSLEAYLLDVFVAEAAFREKLDAFDAEAAFRERPDLSSALAEPTEP